MNGSEYQTIRVVQCVSEPILHFQVALTESNMFESKHVKQKKGVGTSVHMCHSSHVCLPVALLFISFLSHQHAMLCNQPLACTPELPDNYKSGCGLIGRVNEECENMINKDNLQRRKFRNVHMDFLTLMCAVLNVCDCMPVYLYYLEHLDKFPQTHVPTTPCRGLQFNFTVYPTLQRTDCQKIFWHIPLWLVRNKQAKKQHFQLALKMLARRLYYLLTTSS